MKQMIRQSQAGQVGIIILLVTAVILTIEISLSQKTLQEQDIAFIQDESTRVFNAAESGLEEALFDISQGRMEKGELSFDDLNGVNYDIDSKNTFDMNLSSGQAVVIPLNQTNNNMTVRWWNRRDGCNSTNQPSSVLISIFTASSARHLGYDPCSDERGNNLESVNRLSNAEEDCYYKVVVPVTSNDVLVRVRPLYNNSKFNISSNAFEIAQYNILSTAVNDAEDIARTLSVQRSEDGPPNFMDFVLVSGGSLVKN